jgi:glycosyltransferase involved in cell wall biosynthesis
MRILITTCGGVVRGVDWTESNLARELVLRGNEVTVLTSSSVKKVFPDAKKEEWIDGIHVKRFNPILPTSLRWMMKNEFDIINAHFPGWMAPISSWAMLRKRMKTTPVVHNVMGLYHDPCLVEDDQDPLSHPIRYSNMQKGFPWLKPWRAANWFSHLTIFESDAVCALTEWEKAELQKFGVPRERLEIVPNGIKYKNYRAKAKEDFLSKYGVDGPMLLFVGQPIRRKGLEYAVEALPKITSEVSDAKLVVIGYRKEEWLEKAANENESIVLAGRVSESEKISAYQQASAFVLPTLYEGFGTVLIEAMAAGCPIITTRTAGIPEIVKDGRNGLLVEPKSSSQLAAAALKLLGGKAFRKRISAANAKDAKEYDWKDVAKRYESVFQKAISSKK